MIIIFLTDSIGFAEPNPVPTDLTAYQKHIAPFLETHCTECHGAKKQKGDRRFDRLPKEITGVENAETLQEILDQLNLSEDTQHIQADAKILALLCTFF